MIAGFVAFRQPVVTAGVVTLVLAFMFMFQGIFRGVMAVAQRPSQWGWALANGVITLFLGIAVYATWPASALWLLGTVIGVDLLLSGWTMTMVGLTLRREERRSPSLPGGARPTPA